MYDKAFGLKIKTQQAIKLKDVYYDEEGRRCEKERVEIVELEQRSSSLTQQLASFG